jgi:hypothetical protein
MASRQVIDDVRRLCDVCGAKLLLIGDPEQLAAPGAGGTFALIVERVGAATLTEVRRFAAEWERKASLRLRAGDPGVLASTTCGPGSWAAPRPRWRPRRWPIVPGAANLSAGRRQRTSGPSRRAGPRAADPDRPGRQQPFRSPL